MDILFHDFKAQKSHNAIWKLENQESQQCNSVWVQRLENQQD